MKINKRAVMEDFLQLVTWSIIIIIVFFMFTGIKTVKTKSLIDKSRGIENEIDGNYLLLDFLRQKAENSNADDVAELIALYYETKDENVFDEIKKEANGFFSEKFSELSDELWELDIYKSDGSERKSISPFFISKQSVNYIEDRTGVKYDIGSKKTISSTIIPLENEGYVNIELNSIKIK